VRGCDVLQYKRIIAGKPEEGIICGGEKAEIKIAFRLLN
jgi:hypothetical protein